MSSSRSPGSFLTIVSFFAVSTSSPMFRRSANVLLMSSSSARALDSRAASFSSRSRIRRLALVNSDEGSDEEGPTSTSGLESESDHESSAISAHHKVNIKSVWILRRASTMATHGGTHRLKEQG